jgi:type IV pilus assembly protein PilW
MVSLVIGLVIMIAVVSAYLGASGATRVAEAQARMNEDGQAALTVLAQQLRMAGNNPKQPDYDPEITARNPVYNATTYIVRGCDGTFSNVKTAADIKALTCDAGGGTVPDSIAVTYEADRYNTVPSSAGVATDCLGQELTPLNAAPSPMVWDSTVNASVPKAVTFTVAENRFYVGTTTAVPVPSLYCKGNGGATPQSLVENVEDLQLIYGVAAPGAAGLAVAGYLRANQFTSDAGLAALSDPDQWARAVTVRVCVVVRSERPVAPDLDSARYVKCDGTVDTAPPDLRLRRAYSTTVVLRNRVPT